MNMIRAGILQVAPVFGEKEANFSRAVRFFEGAGRLDLVVLPELFATGYRFVSGEEVARLAEPVPGGPTSVFLEDLARRTGGTVVAGVAERAGNAFYNAAAIFAPGGHVGTYRKVHLFDEEKLFFAPGDLGFPVWTLPWGRLGVMICYDWRFPEACRAMALAGADVVAQPSNLVYTDCPRVTPVRAFENRVHILVADRTGEDRRPGRDPLRFVGQSFMADPFGKVGALVGTGQEGLAFADLDLSRARDKRLTDRNDILADRRPDQYGGVA